MTTKKNLFHLLGELKDYGNIKSQDFIAYVLPLLEEVKSLHENNLVAYIKSIDEIVFTDKLSLDTNPRERIQNFSELFAKVETKEDVIKVTDTYNHYTDIDSGEDKYQNDIIQEVEKSDSKRVPTYIPNYLCWDFQRGHYDPLTDIFIIGQVMASIAFGLDFRDKDDLEAFVNRRKNLYFLNTKLHPTILNVIFEMTHLYREDRTANIEEAIIKLKNYREYNPEHYQDLTETEGFRKQDISKRTPWILNRLKNRLFDISRRNKLLYFKENKSFLNLTVSSVPLLLDYKNIQENDLIYWNDNIRKKIIKNKKLRLNNYLDVGSNRYLSPTLNKIRLDARKSKNEYGFSPMRTVIAFLNWYNFKENPNERITSPLLLLPTSIVKKKGVKDQYTLEFSSSEAEINPILSYYLKDLYGIELPGFIDFSTTTIEQLIATIQTQISSGGTGITLNWLKQPQIQLIHSIAKRNFSIKNKRLKNRTLNLNIQSFNYSYSNENYEPLGLQIFNERVKQKHDFLESIINEDLGLNEDHAIAEKTRTFYTSKNNGTVNPTIWEVNTCNITVGNFNYRKMSLVRDYNEIINSNVGDEIFDQLFSEFPKVFSPIETSEYDLNNQYSIIPSDPTQSAAVELARTGASYIIQGPPGTGKSQTITNLIADYIARDKKVLFVCEKRAALDVVFHRLKNRKLDEFCCLIHDSQADKKAFIHNLRDTYNDFIKHPMSVKRISKERGNTIEAIDQEMKKLKYFHQTMKAGDVTPIELYTVLHHSTKLYDNPDVQDQILFPTYSEFKDNISWITEWSEQIQRNNIGKYISDYPLNNISQELIQSNNPKKLVMETANQSLSMLDDFSELMDESNASFDTEMTMGQWKTQMDLAQRIKDILKAGKLSVFSPESTEQKQLVELDKNLQSAKRKHTKALKSNKHWTNKFNPQDADIALKQWTKYSKSIFRFISPGYYKLKNKIKSAYRFDAHSVQPEISDVLQKLTKEYSIEADIHSQVEDAQRQFGLANYEEDFQWIIGMRNKPDKHIVNWSATNQNEYVQFLINQYVAFDKLYIEADKILNNIDRLTISQMDSELNRTTEALGSLSLFIPYIEDSKNVSEELRQCLYDRKWTLGEFHHNLAYKSLADIYEKEIIFSEMDADRLKISADRVTTLFDDYFDDNVAYIRAKTRAEVVNKVRITETLANQLTPEEKVAKKKYNAARRILENEFGKKMRYKSIRELASSDASELMNSLKPVWLMSPLSVSDTMPIDTSIFDVVIYDEASQITVEEGVPSLFRTKQTIIVGDEMQMPPTNFFSSNTYSDEDEEEVESRIGITLDADSLLNQGSRKLSSVMLGWHYRSRHESLISFSNAAFYQRSLLTIPDNRIHESSNKSIPPVIDVKEPVDSQIVLDRSISYHYLENAVYQNRKNRDEADYIANMVCQMLKEKIGLSIGIVAFSMDQQSEIESALERLARTDTAFELLLEEEYQREDEDQFNGLFVKNLENVQGDERDIIIMSVCYGYNSKRRMLMNFGPINRRGGEKRLNVIFSRAKKHMVIVSSILSHEIKNDYNEGANYFKRFLAYAKHISDGDLPLADTVLDGLFHLEEETRIATDNPVVLQLKTALESKGYQLDMNIGQSHFKCDLGIRKEGNRNYLLGILIDKPSFYSKDNVLEQYCQRNAVLSAFGWKIYSVFSKDWLERPERVLESIDLLLAGKENVAEEKIDKEQPRDTKQVENEILQADITPDKKALQEDNLQKEDETLESNSYERYEYIQGNSKKYWEVKTIGSTLYVRYGRIGNTAQVKTKDFESEEMALKEKNTRITKKINKGYTKKDENL